MGARCVLEPGSSLSDRFLKLIVWEFSSPKVRPPPCKGLVLLLFLVFLALQDRSGEKKTQDSWPALSRWQPEVALGWGYQGGRHLPPPPPAKEPAGSKVISSMRQVQCCRLSWEGHTTIQEYRAGLGCLDGARLSCERLWCEWSGKVLAGWF